VEANSSCLGGRDQGTNAYIGIVVGNTDVFGYVCDSS
jgi:hypothetical protein